MCCPCGFSCCGSDEFGRCGCDDCPDPRCHRSRPDAARSWTDEPANDDGADERPVRAPIAARGRFRCEAVVV